VIVNQLMFDGVVEIIPDVHADNRGEFLEAFNGQALLNSAGLNFEVAQTNLSISKLGTVRGIHFADVPPGQAKYVQCVSGKVWDVIVDLRLDSSTFGKWISVLLDSDKHNAVHIPEGFGHGFQALTDEAKLLYQCSTVYNPEAEHEVNPFDATLAITWPISTTFVSEKDKNAPTLKDFFKAV
jgi:dTDP-4-dehydrorhamnose 3,5-epimerase